MKILLATDGSANAEAALDVVLYRPWAEGSQVRVITVIEPINEKLNQVVGLFGLAKTAADARDRFIERTRDLIARYETKLKEKFGAENVSAEVLEGRVKETLVAEAVRFKADTLILGAHGRNESAEFLFGSVPDYVLAHAKCSVEILRAASLSTMITEIEREHPVEEDKYLLALDDSHCSQETLNEVLRRKWPPKSFFKVLTVLEPLPFQAYSGLGPWEGAGSEEYVNLVNKTMEAEQAVAKKVVSDACAKLKEKFADAEVSGEVVEGYAKEQILSLAKSWPADLVILGSHGRGGFMEFVLGSVSKATASHAPCSVLVVRSPANTVDGNAAAKSDSAS